MSYPLEDIGVRSSKQSSGSPLDGLFSEPLLQGTAPKTDSLSNAVDSAMMDELLDASLSSETASQASDRSKHQSPATKRMNKLETLLSTLRRSRIPNMAEHNRTVVESYSRVNAYSSIRRRKLPLMRFAAVLDKLCDMSSTSGFLYGLLSWEIFHREEERLCGEEGLSAIAASKAVNKQMAEIFGRRAKTHDWASDSRKAAKVVFDVLQYCNAAQRSFAVLLLGNNISLDGMLKVAHFPATRESFSAAFAQIVEASAARWDTMAKSGYLVFDYETFLLRRGIRHEDQ